jgi:uncharacterized RDD family membrane protein YckC
MYMSYQPGMPLTQGGAYSPATQAEYANWLYRVGSYVIDALITSALPIFVRILIGAAGQTDSVGNPRGASLVVYLLSVLVSLGVFIWNSLIRQGSTGQSVGKQVTGTRLISLQTHQPIGGGMAFVRQLCHILDALPCYIGYLWPLWDSKRQTFADKLVGTVVVRV